MTIIEKRNKFEIWIDVIFALFIREIRTSFNDKVGISWAVIQPVSFIFILSFLRGRLDGGEAHTIPIFTFMAIGLVFIQSFLKTLGSTARSISKNKALYAFRQVQPISAVIASAMFEILVKIFVILGIILIMFFLGVEITIDNTFRFITCFLLLALLAISIGMIFGIFELFVPEIRKSRELGTRPLFFVSGVFFSLQDIPKEYWHFFDWNPILHAIELARYSVYSSYGNEGVSLNFLAMVSLIFLFISLSIYFSLWKKAISH